MKKIKIILAKTLRIISLPFGFVFICLAVSSAMISGSKWSQIECRMNRAIDALDGVMDKNKSI